MNTVEVQARGSWSLSESLGKANQELRCSMVELVTQSTNELVGYLFKFERFSPSVSAEIALNDSTTSLQLAE